MTPLRLYAPLDPPATSSAHVYRVYDHRQTQADRSTCEKPCYGSHTVMPCGVPNTNNIRTSQDYQTRQLITEEGNLTGPIRTRRCMHTHTDNTRQLKPQLKSSSCSSAILSHNSRDAILSHNPRNATCLTTILSLNSRDTF
ncbi:hypothetical protein DEO72_LG8g2079 [Vigna unguiculata]|uniref:Uncharacterized protein n=1 Tax=Vigna unguiculata TaxID=3917 RepID=A0A4D6MRD5_VIGUN|nr:hypothetical protein DEO72_LG8g2079 [Vigna unguiculata]